MIALMILKTILTLLQAKSKKINFKIKATFGHFKVKKIVLSGLERQHLLLTPLEQSEWTVLS